MALGGGCGFLAGSASALELGEIQLHSALGQPLRASVAYALHSSEQIHDYCIYLRPGIAASGLPTVGDASASVANGFIHIAGKSPVKDPLLTVQLTVDCPNTAHLRREYSLFIDPFVPAQQAAAVPAVVRARTSASSAREVEPREVEAREVEASEIEQKSDVNQKSARSAASTPIAAAQTYRVQPGDSLSGIAARISGRTIGLWHSVDAIFAANPAAFINNDRNLLRAGSLLAIPDAIYAAQSAAPALQAAGGSAVAVVTNPAQPAEAAYAGFNPGASATSPAAEPRATEEASPGSAGQSADRAVVTTPPQAIAPQAGNILSESDSPFVSPIGSTERANEAMQFDAPAEIIPDTSVEIPAARPSVADARSDAGATSDSWSWLVWLGGSGVTLILGLLLFGRRLKERFAPSPAAAGIAQRRNHAADDDDTDVSAILEQQFEGIVPVARVISPDADLDNGAGFADGGEIDVAAREAQDSILVSETPPRRDDNGEYELSTTVDAGRQLDATRQQPGDADERDDTDDNAATDLLAVEFDMQEEDTISAESAPGSDIDYSILEQDYEDEFSATQALNAEIAKAALELSSRMGNDRDQFGDTIGDTTNEWVAEAGDDYLDDETSLLPADGYLSPDDATVAIPSAAAGDDTIGSRTDQSGLVDLDDTANEDITADAMDADNDPTLEADVELDIESATIDTRKMRAS